MQNTRVIQTVIVTLFCVIQISGCSIINRFFPDRSDDYVSAKSTEKLEVPPDLTSKTLSDNLVAVPVRKDPATTEVSQDSGNMGSTSQIKPVAIAEKAGSTPSNTPTGQVVFKREGQNYWLVARGEPAVIWLKARQFWLDKEYELTLDDAAVGVLETDWVNNSAITPGTGKRSILGRVFSNEEVSVFRDRFRMRVEQGQMAGTTEIYIKHQGIEEVLEGTDEEIPVSRWIPRPSESGLESEMLKRLMLSLGASIYEAQHPAFGTATQIAAPGIQSQFKKGNLGKSTVVLQQDFQLAWDTVGRALRSAEIRIDDLNRSKGVYFVAQDGLPDSKKRKGGFFSGIFSDDVKGVDTEEDYDDDRMLVKVEETSQGVTEIIVTDSTGVIDNTKRANRLLMLMQKNIR